MFRRSKSKKIEVDEIFLDSTNMPAFNRGRMEGKLELPITRRNVFVVAVLFILVAVLFFAKLFTLQVIHGAEYRMQSEENRFNEGVIIAERGVIYDRNGEMLAWNEEDYNDEYAFPVRAYTDRHGLGQLLGYVSYPLKDTDGFYYRTEYVGRNGVEAAYNQPLAGTNGKQVIEQNAVGDLISEYATEPPTAGAGVSLSVDAELSEAMYDIIATSTTQAGFRSGAGAIMDVNTGEIIALTSYPSYDPEVMADGDDVALINSYNTDDRFPFLNKLVGGAYTPGSIVKPFVAYAALEAGVISPDKTIISNGQITIPNPYNPSNPSIFRDWRDHGAMTMREGIAFSSNVYFYIVGGGLPEIAVPQAGLDKPLTGLGITKMAENYRRFGLGEKTGINLAQEQAGVVPDPAWKQAEFNDDWRLGDTYFTAIGQYGFLTTPVQMLRAYAALANGGTLLTPHVTQGSTSEKTDLNLNPEYLNIIHEGMRKTVTLAGGTARSLERNDVAIAAKSGTAELGAGNAFVNSWAAGFWPAANPEYAFILMMDKAPRANRLGATTIMGDVVEWISVNRPEYLGIQVANEE